MLTAVHPTPVAPPAETRLTEAEAQAMQRAVLQLLERWDVTDTDAAILLGGMAPRTISRWRAGEFGRVTRDLADRMSLLLGIHKALRILFADPARGYRWIKAPNAAFDGRAALDILLRGGMTDLQRIRAYLDSARGGW